MKLTKDDLFSRGLSKGLKILLKHNYNKQIICTCLNIRVYLL